jgi:hypothetical protein
MKKCPFCSSNNEDSALFCESCGKSIPEPPITKVAQAPSKPFMKLDKLKITLIAAGAIFLVLITVLLPSACSANKAAALAVLPKEKLSPDQQSLIAMAGYPEEFIIIFDEGNANIRTETWVYEDMERYFAFQGGTYTGGEEITPPELKDDKYKVVPEDFVYALKPVDVATLIGSKGDEYIDKTSGLKIIKYGDGLITCSFSPEDALIGISRTRNIAPGGK